MDDLIRPFISKCVIVYIDNILIFSRSWEEHVKQLRQVFDTLKQHQLYLNMDKCSFAMTNIKYLGYVIDSIGIHIDLEKVSSNNGPFLKTLMNLLLLQQLPQIFYDFRAPRNF